MLKPVIHFTNSDRDALLRIGLLVDDLLFMRSDDVPPRLQAMKDEVDMLYKKYEQET